MGNGSLRILVMGSGGIGGLVTAYLSEVGADVEAVTTNPTIYEAIRSGGFQVTGDGNPRTVNGRIHLGIPDGAEYDLVLLATQPPQVEEAARTAAPHLSESGRMMCFQNGLCEQRVAKIVGSDRVVGGIVAWGASMVGPGLYDRTSSGGFTIGRLQGGPDDFLREVGNVLEVIGPVTLSENLLGARWSKLAINCGISSTGTIAGERLGGLVMVRKYRRLCLEIFTEVARVARAEEIKLEKVSGTFDLDWLCLSDEERAIKLGSPALTAKHALLFAVGMRYRRLRSSMLSAIERGRPPAIDFLNGEIVERADRHGIDVPLNRAITDTVHQIARGELSSSRTLLDKIIEQTRPS